VHLWDANIVRAFTDPGAEGHGRVRARTALYGWAQIGLPIVVAAELLTGRLGYVREAHRQAPQNLLVAYRLLMSTLGFLGTISLIPLDERALQVHRNKGLFPGTMGREDRLIASIVLAGGHILVTRNVAHFVNIPGLLIQNWIDDDQPVE
jgi:tRNA(fMet)-specific endonuclease VapC